MTRAGGPQHHHRPKLPITFSPLEDRDYTSEEIVEMLRAKVAEFRFAAAYAFAADLNVHQLRDTLRGAVPPTATFANALGLSRHIVFRPRKG
jgi:hypothetical protein